MYTFILNAHSIILQGVQLSVLENSEESSPGKLVIYMNAANGHLSSIRAVNSSNFCIGGSTDPKQ